MDTHRHTYPIGTLCRVLGVSKSGYFAWVRSEHKRERADAELLVEIRRIHQAHGKNYGSPRIYRELRKQNIACSKVRVERLMKTHGICAKRAKKFKPTTDSNHHHPVAPNVLDGRFDAWCAPNQAWVGDITYVPTQEGFLYLAVLLDLVSRRVVGWAMDKRMKRHLPLRALHMAVQRRKPAPGLIHHTDQGSQYCSKDYQKALKRNHMVVSMSAKGRCYDNAVAKSFFHTLKVECVYGNCFASREQAMSAIFKYMEAYYNTKRMHSSLDYQTPADYEQIMQRQVA